MADPQVTRPEPPTAEHPEARCHRCGRDNLWSWHAPSPLWNAVMRREDGPEPFDGIVCPQCFAALAAEAGVTRADLTIWCVRSDQGVVVELATHDSDGRRWDAERCLWLDAERARPPQAEGLEALVSLVRSGFLVSVGGRRAVADDVQGEPYRTMLMTILTAEDTAAACAALRAEATRDEGLDARLASLERNVADHEQAIGRLQDAPATPAPKP